MPLWLQGALNLSLTALASALAILAILTAIWASNGFETMSLTPLVRMTGHFWLLIHGVPLNLSQVFGAGAPEATLTLIPLGLSVIPLLLCFGAGRRLARASYEGEFFVPVLSGSIAYGIFSSALYALSADSSSPLAILGAAFIPQVIVWLGVVLGGFYESRSLARMVGVDTAEQISHMSQYSRWAGSYVWAVVRAAFVACLALVVTGSLVLGIAITTHWAQIVTVYQELNAGPVGDSALSVLQLGFIPNMVIYAMSWSTGAGFFFGTGTHVGLESTVMGSVPMLPITAAIPASLGPWGYTGLLASVGAGVCAGIWFLREGEDHLEEWLWVKTRMRFISYPVAALGTGLLVGALSAVVMAALGWAASGSLGLGHFTQIGVGPADFALGAFVTLGAGTALGNMLARVVIHDESRSLPRFAREPELSSDAEVNRAAKTQEKSAEESADASQQSEGSVRAKRSLRGLKLSRRASDTEEVTASEISSEIAETETSAEIVAEEPVEESAPAPRRRRDPLLSMSRIFAPARTRTESDANISVEESEEIMSVSSVDESLLEPVSEQDSAEIQALNEQLHSEYSAESMGADSIGAESADTESADNSAGEIVAPAHTESDIEDASEGALEPEEHASENSDSEHQEESEAPAEDSEDSSNTSDTRQEPEEYPVITRRRRRPVGTLPRDLKWPTF
ncbi:DUF6350 family protein [Rothia sp. (in: high G+C Gram-positive bacteria)]|uniref:cell division protein PerM n=1 Tax=Rothia sp. (in: high G+C Gram-positive bacteria) TaxID=1885016 RepID=UPI0026E110EC|nr:DUF6350 family protein [Rothia sp. (in: high G+C Gram-positive bacteria)]